MLNALITDLQKRIPQPSQEKDKLKKKHKLQNK